MHYGNVNVPFLWTKPFHSNFNLAFFISNALRIKHDGKVISQQKFSSRYQAKYSADATIVKTERAALMQNEWTRNGDGNGPIQ